MDNHAYKTIQADSCLLCPRACGVNRQNSAAGYCGVSSVLKVARAALHMWEEPCISGAEGSGAVFFAGCSLGCIYCQNREIAAGDSGIQISISRLSEIFLELQEKHANNINLVTAGHYVPQTAEALRQARQMGLRIPVVYNSSGYEKKETLRLLEGLVDVYLPDFKYFDRETAKEYSSAEDYPETAREAVEEMVRQTAAEGCSFDQRGIMTRGVIIRHLLLPGHVKEAKKIVSYLYQTYKDRIYLSLMSQYTPMPAVSGHPLLGRKVTPGEYGRLIDYVISLGIKNAYIQEGDVAEESFIPAFDGEGVIREPEK